jgi:hypothetical protein
VKAPEEKGKSKAFTLTAKKSDEEGEDGNSGSEENCC